VEVVTEEEVLEEVVEVAAAKPVILFALLRMDLNVSLSRSVITSVPPKTSNSVPPGRSNSATL